MENGQQNEYAIRMDQLAVHYQVGQPLALHRMNAWCVHFFKIINRVLLYAANFAVFFALACVIGFLLLYLPLGSATGRNAVTT